MSATDQRRLPLRGEHGDKPIHALPAAGWALLAAAVGYTHYAYGYGYGYYGYYGWLDGLWDELWMGERFLLFGLLVGAGSYGARHLVARLQKSKLARNELRLRPEGIEWWVDGAVAVAFSWARLEVTESPLVTTERRGKNSYQTITTGKVLSLHAAGHALAVWHGTHPPAVLAGRRMRLASVDAFDALVAHLDANGIERRRGPVPDTGLFVDPGTTLWSKAAAGLLIAMIVSRVTGFGYMLGRLTPLVDLLVTVLLLLRAWPALRRWRALADPAPRARRHVVRGGTFGQLELEGEPSRCDTDGVALADAFVHERAGEAVRLELQAASGDAGPYRGSGIARASFVEPLALTELRAVLRNAAGLEVASRALFAILLSVTYLRSFWYAY